MDDGYYGTLRCSPDATGGRDRGTREGDAMPADELSDEARDARLTAWFAAQLSGSDDVRLDGLDRVPMGHSAETLTLAVVWHDDVGEHHRDVVLRARPPAPGLLEPYDLRKQFD